MKSNKNHKKQDGSFEYPQNMFLAEKLENEFFSHAVLTRFL